MPQIFTSLLNKTIAGQGFTAVAVPQDSLSIRLINLQPGTYVELYGIAWGVRLFTQGADTLDTGSLQIIRNEIFDPNFAYGDQLAIDRKDVIFEAHVNQNRHFEWIPFIVPFRLDDAPNYLIIATNFGDFTNPAITFNPVLTVQGAFIKESNKEYQYYKHPR